MATFAQVLRSLVGRRQTAAAADAAPGGDAARRGAADEPAVDIAPNDPLLAVLESASGAVDLDTLKLHSPAKDALQAAGVKLVVPLVTQGELIGVLNLGPRLSEQEYSSEDRKLLENLASQAAPAVRVAQLVREQQAEARQRERIAHELQVARLIQQNFLPKELPALSGWRIGACYRPAREVSGDFYDFIELPEGKLGIVIGDVTDKGVPAALVMSATRSVLRAVAGRLVLPGEVLRRTNELMCPDTPPNMFITCFYAVLDPATGRLQYANAGHDVPYVRTTAGTAELRARGMPLGLMPGMEYEEKETVLAPGETLVLYSDGIVEAHNPQEGMFGFPRLRGLLAEHSGDETVIDYLLAELDAFTGDGWEQEDDVTLVTLRRAPAAAPATDTLGSANGSVRLLDEFTLPSESGNEIQAMERVAQAVAALALPERRLKRLKTAVAEATMNAIEHGNRNRADLPVAVRVSASDHQLAVRITDLGGGRTIPEPEVPDLEAKLAGEQKARGWGLFLIKNMVDEMDITSDETHHTVELRLHLGEEAIQEGPDASSTNRAL